MLISILKKKDEMKRNGGLENNTICLVPELCNMTGLTEMMKSNYNLMRDLQNHTLITPDVRQEALVHFVKLVKNHESASKVLKDWGLHLSPIPVKTVGPVYNQEKVLLGNNISIDFKDNWQMEVAKRTMFSVMIINICYPKTESYPKI